MLKQKSKLSAIKVTFLTHVFITMFSIPLARGVTLDFTQLPYYDPPPSYLAQGVSFSYSSEIWPNFIPSSIATDGTSILSHDGGSSTFSINFVGPGLRPICNVHNISMQVYTNGSDFFGALVSTPSGSYLASPEDPIGYNPRIRTMTYSSNEPILGITFGYLNESYAGVLSLTFDGGPSAGELAYCDPLLDLSAGNIQISQAGSLVSPGGNVSPNLPLSISVPVSGIGLKGNETRYTLVTLKVESQTRSQTLTQALNITTLQSAGGTFSVPFNVTFGAQDVGLQTITATVDPGNALSETNFTNNTASIDVRVTPGSALDLSVNEVSLHQLDGTLLAQDTDGNYIIPTVTPPNTVPAPKISPTPVQAQVSVNMSGTPSSNTATTLDLSFNGLPLVSQPVDISKLKQGPNIITVSFTPPTDPNLLGLGSIVATINSNQTIKETNYSNNSSPIPINTMILCKVEDAGTIVPFWSQADSRWAEQAYGNPANSDYEKPTMVDLGCSVTDLAMLASSHGITNMPFGSPATPFGVTLTEPPGLNGEALNPGTLDYAMTNYKTNFMSVGSVGFDASNDPLWPGAVDVLRAGYQAQCQLTGSCDPNNSTRIISYKHQIPSYASQADAIAGIKNEVCSGNPVILKFSTPKGQHFMLATGIVLDDFKNQTLRLNNPGTKDGQSQFYSKIQSQYPALIGGMLFRPSADPAMILVTAPMNVDFVVTDPQGRRSGYDPNSGIKYSEIPGATYEIQSVNTPNEPGYSPKTLTSEKYFVSSLDAPEGNYQVQVFALTSGNYYLDYRSYDSSGTTNDAHYKTGSLSQSSSENVVFQHLTSAAPVPNASLQLSKYIITKSHGQNPKDSDIRLSGLITPASKSQIILSSNILLSLGGITGYQFTLPASKFKITTQRKQNVYSYNDSGTAIRVASDGSFDIHIYHADLSSIDPTLLGSTTVAIDSVISGQYSQLKCQGDVCSIGGSSGQ